MYDVEVTIIVREAPINGRWHIKWEPNIVKEIACPVFKFTASDMETAMNRINYLIEVHPEKYFTSIEINNKEGW